MNAMNIYIDYTTVIDLENDIGTYTGAGSYTRDVISVLKEHGVDFKILVYKDYVPQKRYERELMPDETVLIRIKDITVFDYSNGGVLFLPVITGRIMAKAERIKKKYDNLKIYAVIHDRQHNISHFDPMDRYFHEGIYRVLSVLYVKYIVKKIVYDFLYPRWIKSIDKVFAVSNYTLQELNHKNLKRITYLYQSTSVARYSPSLMMDYDDIGEYILFVSGGRPEKNLGRALLAFRDFCKKTDTKCKLCITGIDRKKLYYIADRLKLTRKFTDKYIKAYDYVNAGELAYLYKNCRYLLFVSKGEGFGLPVLEAIQFGKTVLCSRQSSIPEVAGGILYYVDAFNVASITEGMLYLNDDKRLLYREKLVEKKKHIIDEQIELDKHVLVDEIVEE